MADAVAVAKVKDINAVMSDYLNLNSPKSFFLFAGAGSGKTRALVDAMKIIRQNYGQEFRLSARKIAVITYTNAACDEIKHRIDYDPIFAVSTIHSFAWELIRYYHKDIREWLRLDLQAKITELMAEQQKGRAGTKAAAEREIQIQLKQKRLESLDTLKYFTYNPNGENIGKNSLTHTEVIGIAAGFSTNKPLMQKALIHKYPILLIDESQDTQKDLVDAFFRVQQAFSGKFCLALFGDMMQRIYADGKENLHGAVPDSWEKPAITINYRCPKRIVILINLIRADVDGHMQQPKKGAPEGFVRLFLVQDKEGINKTDIEAKIAKMMAEITSDKQWTGEDKEIKILTLEHHMAARRGGFINFFEPLYQIAKFKTGLLDGTLSGVPFFAQQVMPLVKALQSQDKFAIARIIKKYSPLVSADALKKSTSSLDEIHKVDTVVKSLFELWVNDADPLLIDILKKIKNNGLFAIPDVFAPIISLLDSTEENKANVNDGEIDKNPDIDAWGKALYAPFSQFESYEKYISDKSSFGTHQGIKGLEFPRVMVILDDNEARGFMFSYDKLLGAEAPTSTDRRNAQEGKETSIERTRRLFYVTCSRTQSSLAIVAYTREKDKIISHLKGLKWFDSGEIVYVQ